MTMRSRRIGRYELLDLMGQNAHFSLYQAIGRGAHGFEKRVALKTLENPKAHAQLSERFFRNAAQSMSWSHSQLAQRFDLALDGERPISATEYVPGMNLSELADVLRPGVHPSFGPAEFQATMLFVASEVAKALDYLHRRVSNFGAVFHGGVCAQNILVSHDGRVKLADTGTSRRRLLGFEALDAELLWELSPQRVDDLVRGADGGDSSADIYALAMTLHAVLLDAHPYANLSRADVVARIRAGDVDVSAHPEALRGALSFCLGQATNDASTPTTAADAHEAFLRAAYATGASVNARRLSQALAYTRSEHQSAKDGDGALSASAISVSVMPLPTFSQHLELSVPTEDAAAMAELLAVAVGPGAASQSTASHFTIRSSDAVRGLSALAELTVLNAGAGAHGLFPLGHAPNTRDWKGALVHPSVRARSQELFEFGEGPHGNALLRGVAAGARQLEDAPRFSGRQRLLKSLGATLQRAAAGQTQVVNLVGPARVGKTRLGQAFIQRIRERLGGRFLALDWGARWAGGDHQLEDFLDQLGLGKREVDSLLNYRFVDSVDARPALGASSPSTAVIVERICEAVQNLAGTTPLTLWIGRGYLDEGIRGQAIRMLMETSFERSAPICFVLEDTPGLDFENLVTLEVEPMTNAELARLVSRTLAVDAITDSAINRVASGTEGLAGRALYQLRAQLRSGRLVVRDAMLKTETGPGSLRPVAELSFLARQIALALTLIPEGLSSAALWRIAKPSRTAEPSDTAEPSSDASNVSAPSDGAQSRDGSMDIKVMLAAVGELYQAAYIVRTMGGYYRLSDPILGETLRAECPADVIATLAARLLTLDLDGHQADLMLAAQRPDAFINSLDVLVDRELRQDKPSSAAALFLRAKELKLEAWDTRAALTYLHQALRHTFGARHYATALHLADEGERSAKSGGFGDFELEFGLFRVRTLTALRRYESAESAIDKLLAHPELPSASRQMLGRDAIRNAALRGDYPSAFSRMKDYDVDADDREGMYVLLTVALARAASGDAAQAQSIVESVGEKLEKRFAQEGASDTSLALALTKARSVIAFYDDRLSDAYALCQDARITAKRLGRRDEEAVNLHNLAEVALWLGRDSDAYAAAERSRTLAIELGESQLRYGNERLLGYLEGLRTDFEHGEARIRQALRFSRREKYLWHEIQALYFLGAFQSHVDRDQALETLRAALELAKNQGHVYYERATSSALDALEAGRPVVLAGDSGEL